MAGLRADGRGRRAQLLLVAAFGIAVLLLVLAAVVNTVALTESIATRPDDTYEGRDVEAFQNSTTRAVQGIVARTNRESGDYAAKRDRTRQRVDNWSAVASRTQAVDAAGTEVTVVDTTEGNRITQTNTTLLTNATGASDWTLANDTNRTRLFRLDLNTSTLVPGDCAGGADCFTVVLDNGSVTWRLAVNDSEVYVDGPATSGTCDLGPTGVISPTNGTVNGTDCPPLAFAEGLEGDYTIEYRNGDNANGTYRLTVDGTAVASNYGSDPSVDAAIYAATVRISYQAPRVRYTTEVRVARGEPDE